MIRYALLLLVCSFSLSVGCAETRTEQEGAGSEGEGGGEQVATEPDAVRAPGACPRSFGDQSPTCTADDFPSECTYPEGTCGCRQPTYCGGAAPPPMPETFVCEPTPVPCPTAGTPCSGEGRCSNQRCGWQGVACENGVWTDFMLPPPP